MRSAPFLLLWLVLAFLAHGVEITDGPRIATDETTALITWRTDTVCGASVRFGIDPQKLAQKKDAAILKSSLEHEVMVNGLSPGTTYYAQVGTAKVPLKTITFKTLESALPGTGKKISSKETGAEESPAKPPPQPLPPPARETWGYLDSLPDHFNRHGQDFRARSAEDYAAQAWLFLQRAMRDGLPAKVDGEGVIRVWEPKTRAFAAYTPQGKTKTYFKPNDPSYFERQPGKPVRLKKKP